MQKRTSRKTLQITERKYYQQLYANKLNSKENAHIPLKNTAYKNGQEEKN